MQDFRQIRCFLAVFFLLVFVGVCSLLLLLLLVVGQAPPTRFLAWNRTRIWRLLLLCWCPAAFETKILQILLIWIFFFWLLGLWRLRFRSASAAPTVTAASSSSSSSSHLPRHARLYVCVCLVWFACMCMCVCWFGDAVWCGVWSVCWRRLSLSLSLSRLIFLYVCVNDECMCVCVCLNCGRRFWPLYRLCCSPPKSTHNMKIQLENVNFMISGQWMKNSCRKERCGACTFSICAAYACERTCECVSVGVWWV